KSIGKHLLNLPLFDGEVIAFLPESTTVERSKNFGPGGVAKNEKLKLPVIDFMSRYLEGSDERYAVFDDPLAQSGSVATTIPNEQFFVCDSEVYPFVTATDNYRQRLRKSLSLGTWYFVGILTSLQEGINRIHVGQRVRDDTLQMLADRADHILVN